MFLLIIKVSSKNENSLKNFIKLIIKLCKKKNLKFTFVNCLHKKNRNKKFSVLTSPNANKNAQEQFLFKTYSKQVTIFAFKIEKLLVFLKKINQYLFADITIKLDFFLSKNFLKKIVTKIFDPENFKTIIFVSQREPFFNKT